ncbi:Bowman-Birk type trypsin inhibitor [Zea mays]|uniref:Bowman-Birk type trypsin inhibitor n=1 Tax=Zea mays TaxID=4577 RepID=A0A1D6MM96_MAIZE|nr:Bowman-Birk type trypsin inhibitor [Zea mays]
MADDKKAGGGDPGPRCGDGEDDGGEWSPTPRLARGHRF